jgi:hypothetical protein
VAQGVECTFGPFPFDVLLLSFRCMGATIAGRSHFIQQGDDGNRNVVDLFRALRTVVSIAAALGFDDEFVTEVASGHQSDYTLEGWTVQEWSEWGRRKATIASTVARERGALRRRVSDLDEKSGR